MSGLIAGALVVSAAAGVAGAYASSNAASANTKAGRAMQAYNNKMKQLSATLSQNSITRNQLRANDALTAQGMSLKRDSIFMKARVEVSAASAGVKGNSVNRTLRETIGDAAAREVDRQEAWKETQMDIDSERYGIEVSTAMGQDYSYIPKPNTASYYLSAAANTASSVAGAYGKRG